MSESTSPPLPPVPAKKRGILITLIVLNFLQVASLPPWLLMAGLSVMAFDAPGSQNMWQPWAFVLAIWSYPLWLIAADVVAWMFYAFRKRIIALVITIIFSLPAIALVGLMVAGWVSGWFL